MGGVKPDIGCNTHGCVPAGDWTKRYQRSGEVCSRYLCRSRRRCHNVLEVAVEAGDTRHEWVGRVEGTQCECIEREILRVVVRVVVTTHPSAVDSVWRAGPYIAKPVLHDYPTSIHVVRQIVTKRIRVEEREIAVRHNDVVLLK